MSAVLPATPSGLAVALRFVVALGTAAAQTSTRLPLNSHRPADDVELGREAAAVISQQLPSLTDGHIDTYIEALGRRLVDAIPARSGQLGFEYRFIVLNVTELTSIALPGGPIFISRGIIELAPTEDALAGMMAHELSHVVLRHATVQATAGERYQIGAITGRAIGKSVGGQPGDVMRRSANFSVRTYFLMYDAEHERRADLMAVHIMARAGYDPNEMALMIQTITGEGTGYGGLRWSMSHPAPRYHDTEMSRAETISREAAKISIEGAPPLGDGLDKVQMRLADMPPGHNGQRAPHALGFPRGTVGYGVVVPSGEFRSVTAGDLLQLDVPANWRRLPAGHTVIFAPSGAFIELQDGPAALTHGVQIGLARSVTGDLEGDTQALLEALGRDDPRFIWTPSYQHLTIGRRSALHTVSSHVSSVTGYFEYVSMWTLYLPDDSFLFIIGIAPQEEAGTYRNAFNGVVGSLQILE